MSLLHADPASLVVGWAAVDRIDSEWLQERLTNGHPVSTVGKQSPDTVSLEGLIGLAPDLVVTTAFMTIREICDKGESPLSAAKLPCQHEADPFISASA
jgi:ABC-type Fe3+-hydroxamate transport system substrate-binding protein